MWSVVSQESFMNNSYLLQTVLAGMVLGIAILSGCSKKEPEPAPAAQSSAAAGQTPQSETKPADAAPAEEGGSKSPAVQEASRTGPAKSASTQAAKPPSAEAPAEKAQTTKAAPKDVVLLKASLGTVTFQHKTHSESRKIACETCHHVSHPEKAATMPQEACSKCHTPVATSPMKTKLQAAFHNPRATAGICIDCHKAENAKGKAAPVKCLDCHKKEKA
jgi:hypothetical protein